MQNCYLSVLYICFLNTSIPFLVYIFRLNVQFFVWIDFSQQIFGNTFLQGAGAYPLTIFIISESIQEHFFTRLFCAMLHNWSACIFLFCFLAGSVLQQTSPWLFHNLRARFVSSVSYSPFYSLGLFSVQHPCLTCWNHIHHTYNIKNTPYSLFWSCWWHMYSETIFFCLKKTWFSTIFFKNNGSSCLAFDAIQSYYSSHR